MMAQAHPLDLTERVGRLEGTIERIDKDLQNILAGQSSFGSEIGALRDLMGKSGRTNWPAVFAGVGIALTMAAMGGGLIGFIFSVHSQQIQECKTLIADSGHTNLAWQRETNKNLDAQIQENTENVRNLKQWRLEHTERNAYALGRIDSEISTLDKTMGIVEARQFTNTGMIHDVLTQCQDRLPTKAPAKDPPCKAGGQ
jgi:hypothetical protein